MAITGLLADECPNSAICPRIHDTDGDTVIVQGDAVTDPDTLAELALPAHEVAAEVPRSLIYGHRNLDLNELVSWIGRRHTRDLFRLEVRDHYAVDSDGDDYHRYLRGDAEPNAAAKQPWLDALAADTAAGKVWRKVHVVSGPLSSYERYEFEWGFAYNVVAGEQVRILDLSANPDRANRVRALGEFFVLDNEHAARNLYDDDGRFRHAQIVYGGEAAALGVVVDWLWDEAEPFESWWERHPQCHRDPRAA